MTNKEVYKLAVESLNHYFGDHNFSPDDALRLAYFLQDGLGGRDGTE